MLTRWRRQAFLRDRYLTALRHDPAAGPPAGLNTATAEFTARLAADAGQLNASVAFVDRLQRRLEAEARAMAAPSDTNDRDWTTPALDTRRRSQPVRAPEPDNAADHTITAVSDQIADQPVPLRPRWTRELVKLAAAILVFAAVGAVLVLALRDDTAEDAGSPDGSPAAEPSITATGVSSSALPEIGEVVARITAGSGSRGNLAIGAGAVWVTNDADGTISRIDPATNEVVATIVVGEPATVFAPDVYGISYGEGAIWVTRSSAREVVRIDPATNAVVARIEIIEHPADIAVGDGCVWIATSDDVNVMDSVVFDVMRIDPTTNEVVESIDLDTAGGALAAGAGALWLVAGERFGIGMDTYPPSIIRIDPATNAIVATIELRDPPRGVVVDASGVWVRTRNATYRIDPATNAFAGTVSGPSATTTRGIAAGGGFIWITANGPVYRLDPATNALTGRIPNPESPGTTSPQSNAIAFGEGSLWIVTSDNEVIRVDVTAE
jgi:YVTN family beta-propeller protein